MGAPNLGDWGAFRRNMCMKIRYYDANDEFIIEINVDAEEYLEAAGEGHRIMNEGIIQGAVEFQLVQDDE